MDPTSSAPDPLRSRDLNTLSQFISGKNFSPDVKISRILHAFHTLKEEGRWEWINNQKVYESLNSRVSTNLNIKSLTVNDEATYTAIKGVFDTLKKGAADHQGVQKLEEHLASIEANLNRVKTEAAEIADIKNTLLSSSDKFDKLLAKPEKFATIKKVLSSIDLDVNGDPFICKLIKANKLSRLLQAVLTQPDGQNKAIELLSIPDIIDCPVIHQLCKNNPEHKKDLFIKLHELDKKSPGFFEKALAITDKNGDTLLKNFEEFLTLHTEILFENFDDLLPLLQELAKTTKGLDTVKKLLSQEILENEGKRLLEDPDSFKIALPLLKTIAKTDAGKEVVKELLSMTDYDGKSPLNNKDNIEAAIGWFKELANDNLENFAFIKELMSTPQEDGKPLIHTPCVARSILRDWLAGTKAIGKNKSPEYDSIMSLFKIQDNNGNIPLENPKVLLALINVFDLPKAPLSITKVVDLLSLKNARGKPIIHDVDIFKGAALGGLLNDCPRLMYVQDSSGKCALDNPRNYVVAYQYLETKYSETKGNKLKYINTVLPNKLDIAPIKVLTRAHVPPLIALLDEEKITPEEVDNLCDMIQNTTSDGVENPKSKLDNTNFVVQCMKERQGIKLDATIRTSKAKDSQDHYIIKIKTSLAEVKEKPEGHLAKLSEKILKAHKADKDKGLSLFVELTEDAYNEAYDTGGVSALYIGTLFKQLVSKGTFELKGDPPNTHYIPKASQPGNNEIPNLSPVERKVFEDMGVVLKHLYNQGDVPCGNLFNQAFFNAILNLPRIDVNTDFDQLPPNAVWEICAQLYIGDPLVSANTKHMMLNILVQVKELETILEKENQGSLSAEQEQRKNSLVQEIAQPLMDYTMLNEQEYDPASLLKALKEQVFNEQLQQAAPIHAIARGMRSLSVTDWTTDWEEIQNTGAAKVKLDIQGKPFTREGFADALKFDQEEGLKGYREYLDLEIKQAGEPKKSELLEKKDQKLKEAAEVIEKKIGWIKEWILAPGTPENQLIDFLKYITNKDGPPENGISIHAQIPGESGVFPTFPKSHTCADLLEISPGYVNPDDKLNDRTKEGFISCILKAIELAGSAMEDI